MSTTRMGLVGTEDQQSETVTNGSRPSEIDTAGQASSGSHPDGIKTAGPLHNDRTARPRVAKVPCALAGYCLFWVLVFWAALSLPSLEDGSCFGILGYKHQLLESAPSPKIVITGGSNVLFGVDSPKIGEAFHRKVVDMGVCLMFPLAYLFEEIKDSLKPGDIVILSPEYSSYSQEFQYNMVMADILDGFPRAIEWILRSNSATWEEKGKIIFHLRTLGLQKLNYTMTHMRQILQHRCKWSFNKPNPGLDVLNVRNMNDSGDLIWHLSQPKNPQAVDRKTLLAVPKHVDEYTVNEINNFADYCKARQVTFVVIPPPIPDERYAKSKGKIDNVLVEARQKLRVPILADAQRYSFPFNLIFNGHYHLDHNGRAIRTQRIIEDLKKVVSPEAVKAEPTK